MSSPFPKILHIGDKAIHSLFDEEVEITEKLDGSQFGFGIINGELIVRSKGKEQNLDSPDRMFRLGVEYVKSIEGQLTENAFYYGEYLEKPRHSTLAYDKVPRNNIALFAVNMGGIFREYAFIEHEANRLKIDVMPLIYQGKSNPEHVLELVDGVSYLGGSQREGVVVKNYKEWQYLDRIYFPIMAGKFVTEKFKEVHNKDWAKNNTGKGKMEMLLSQYKSEARWNKAIQHIKENGELEGSPRDIGNLIKEIRKDVVEEEKESIKAHLWALYGSDFQYAATNGFPQWYKEKLLKGEIDA